MRRVVPIAVLAAALAVGVAVGQGRDGRATAKPLPGLPAYTAGYRGWFKLNRRPIPPRQSDAHLGTKNVYASKRIRSGRYPYGTVIVKEIVRPGSRAVGVVAVMRKRRGFAPRSNDWEMIEYGRDSARGRFGAFAEGQICYACHVQARANDYVFTRR